MTDTDHAREAELREIGFPKKAIESGRNARKAGLFASDPPPGLSEGTIAALRAGRARRRTPGKDEPGAT